MKKYFVTFCSACLSLLMLQSCITNGDNPSTPSNPTASALEEIVTIEGATYHEGAMPAATTTAQISGVNYNARALQGGSDFITINTDETYTKFYVAIKGVPGYYEFVPEALTRAANNYVIPLIFDEDYSDDTTVYISGEDENGDVTDPYEAEIIFVETQIGDLNVTLTFDQLKDVDLHLYTPGGQHIYYAARGGSYTLTDGSTVSYGLDHDSNAGCHIDGLNNENIFIPAELIEAGTYTVVVDMYSNCAPQNAPTNWNVIARYQGQTIVPTFGANPVSGTYATNCGNGDMTTVMKFQLTAPAAARGAAKVITNSFVATPTSDLDMVKAIDAGWIK